MHFIQAFEDNLAGLALARLDDKHLVLDHVQQLVNIVSAQQMPVHVIDKLYGSISTMQLQDSGGLTSVTDFLTTTSGLRVQLLIAT